MEATKYEICILKEIYQKNPQKNCENITIQGKLEISTKMLWPKFWTDILIYELYYKTSYNVHGYFEQITIKLYSNISSIYMLVKSKTAVSVGWPGIS